MHPEDFYERQRITLLTGTEVVRIDAGRRIARLADGRDLPYSRCLLATGGRARELPGLPRGTPGVHYIRTLDDAAALRAPRARHASPSSAAASWAWKWRPPRVRWGRSHRPGKRAAPAGARAA